METPVEDLQDTHIVLLGTLVFLGVVFVCGLLVNIPAGVIYIRSKQIRGLTDKFILFILISDVIALFTFLPVSFLSVLEINNSLSSRGGQTDGHLRDRPLFSEDGDFLKDSGDLRLSSAFEDEFSSFCVQQWTFTTHQFLFILTANLAVLGATKITLERYLAVVAPLHYHKILKSSLIFTISFASFLMSIVFAFLAVMDSEDTPATQIASQCTPKSWARFFSASAMSTKQSGMSSMQLDPSITDLVDGIAASSNKHISTMKMKESLLPMISSNQWWWPVLKLVHAVLFFVIPVISMIYMYLRIWSEAKKQNARMAYHNKSHFILPADVKKGDGGINVDGLQQIFAKFKLVQRIKRKARLDRAARVALLTIGFLTLCFGMLYFVQIFMAISSLTNSNMFAGLWNMRKKEQNRTFSIFLQLLPMLLASLHSLLSPLVYVYRYKRVRAELKLLFNSMISKLCCCCNHGPKKDGTCDCQIVINQINQLAEKLPNNGFDASVSQQMLESQASSASISQNDVAIQIDLKYPEAETDGLDSVASDIPPESDLESQEYKDREISSPPRVSNGFFQLFNCWMSSYSRRWNQHRESVTSTASFITLLSTRSKSIHATDI